MKYPAQVKMYTVKNLCFHSNSYTQITRSVFSVLDVQEKKSYLTGGVPASRKWFQFCISSKNRVARDPLLIIGRIDVNLFKAGSECVLNTRLKCVQKYNFSKNFANGCMYLLSLMAPRLNFSISSVNFNDLPSRFPFTGRANVGVFTLLFYRG